MISDKGLRVLALALVCVMLATSLISCGPTAEPTRAPEPTEAAVEPTEAPEPTKAPEPPVEGVKIVVIGKSVHPYWSNVEKGVVAAGKDLGVETVFSSHPRRTWRPRPRRWRPISPRV